jgi:hypothetical protein
MKKFNICYLIFCLLTSSLHAQQILETLPPLSTNFIIKGIQGKGFFLGYVTLDQKYEIRRYDNDCKIIWKEVFEIDAYDKAAIFRYSPVFFPSANGNDIYTTDRPPLDGIMTYSSKTKLIKIDSKGTVTPMEYKPVDKNALLRYFAMGNHLYRLSGVKTEDIKVKDGILELTKLDFETKNHKTIRLQLPEQKISSSTTGWQYAAHTNTAIYFSSRTMDLINKKYEYTIAITDSEGVLTKEIKLKGETKECMYPAQPIHLSPGDSYKNSSSMLNANPGEGYFYPKIGGYGNVFIDTANKCFYVYGMQGNCVEYNIGSETKATGEVPVQTLGNKFLITSVYIHKYNFEGQEVFKKEVKVTPVFAENWISRFYQTKFIAARIDKDNNFEVCPATLKIGALSSPERYTFHITVSPDGETKTTKEYNYTNSVAFNADEIHNIFDTDNTIATAEKEKHPYYSVYDTGSGKVVARYFEKERVLKLMVYKQ